MTKEKELGYKLCNVLFDNLTGFQELWNKAEYDTKELIINRLGSISTMKLKDFETIIKGVSQEHLDNDVEVKFVSAYGGKVVWEGNISEVLETIEKEERIVNRDFYVLLA